MKKFAVVMLIALLVVTLATIVLAAHAQAELKTNLPVVHKDYVYVSWTPTNAPTEKIRPSPTRRP